jgi:hypothetical protein
LSSPPTAARQSRIAERLGDGVAMPDTRGMPDQETFKTSWRGWITSSDNYSIRLGSRTGIQWRDSLGEMHIAAERMAGPPDEFVVYSGSIPDAAERPRAQVLERLSRIFEHYEWTLTVEDAGLK